MRLIDADALLKKATGYRRQTLRGRRYGAAVDVADIMSAPTIRPTEPKREYICKCCRKAVK